MATEKIRIKDIAVRAGVSVGTVDRVLHDRPNVSPKALEKVKKALEEMDYKPNMYAAALAYNKSYNFYIVLPKHEQEAYWDEIEEGAQACADFRSDFGITLKFVYYERFNNAAFTRMVREFFTAKIDGVIIVPTTLEQTSRFTEKLTERQIPYVLLDSYMPDLKPLSFFGQDSFASGYFAAKMLMLIASKEKEIALMKQTRDGKVASKQQANRETGFRHYMVDHCPEIKITEVDLPLDEEHKEYDSILEKFFREHPKVHHCITFNSKAHLVGLFLQHTNRRNVQIMGYDMVPKNEECVRQGSISFLIAQHAYQQGYSSVDVLFNAIVMKRAVTPVNYMPIEILTKENVDFYRRKAI
jgi:LacI family transcriptional regulator